MAMKSDSPAFHQFAEALRERETLRAQRDALLDALEEVLAQAEELHIGGDWEDRGFYGLKHARAAIARAKGETK